MVATIEEALELDRKIKTRSPPQYTYEEAVNKIMQVNYTDYVSYFVENYLL